jgi:hypothetical protein
MKPAAAIASLTLLLAVAVAGQDGSKTGSTDTPAAPATAPATAKVPLTRLEPNSRWDVAYRDSALGIVTGEAIVDKTGLGAEVKLTAPGSLVPRQCKATIKIENNTALMTITGQQPGPTAARTPDLSALPQVRFNPDQKQLHVRVKKLAGDLGARAKGTADLNQVTVKMQIGETGDMYGEWSYRADPFTERDRLGRGRVGSFRLLDEPALIGEQQIGRAHV